MRSNVDYGIAVLPVGEAIELKETYLHAPTLKVDTAHFNEVLSRSPEPFQKDQAAETEVITDLFMFGAESASREEQLTKYIDTTWNQAVQKKQIELDFKIPPEILPESWINIRSSANDLYIEFKTTSANTRHWLLNIAASLSSTLHSRLRCRVTVVVSEEENSPR